MRMKMKRSPDVTIKFIFLIMLGGFFWLTPTLSVCAVSTKLAVLGLDAQGRFEAVSNATVSRTISDWMTQTLLQNGRFQLVERQLIDQILRSHQLQAAGVIDGKKATQIGTLLGVDAIITGTIINLGNRTDLNIRVIDIQTAAIRAAENAQAPTWELLRGFMPGIVDRIAGLFPIRGIVVRRTSQEILLDIGRQNGVKIDTVLAVSRTGQPIFHPQTGRQLGVERTPVGKIQVIEVDDKMAYAHILSEQPSFKIQTGDLVEAAVETEGLQKGSSGIVTEDVSKNDGISKHLFETAVKDLARSVIANTDIAQRIAEKSYWPRIRAEFEKNAEALTGRWLVDRTVSLDIVLAWLCNAIEKRPELHDRAVENGFIPYRQNRLGMTFVYVPAGSFMMGSPVSEAQREIDETQVKIELSEPFYMMTTEVTQEQWRRVMGNRPAFFDRCGADCPVEQVSWEDIQAFLRRLNTMESAQQNDAYGLPSEAQWEFVCRAGRQGIFTVGNCLLPTQANFDGGYPYPSCASGPFLAAPIAVKRFPPNRWGVFDLHGNVMEWCHTAPGAEPYATENGTGLRVAKGGSWFNGAGKARCASRLTFEADFRNNQLGFRLTRKISGLRQ
jgi:formylglycine-generating enzyme required for sulfatase activity/TolB-like protein